MQQCFINIHKIDTFDVLFSYKKNKNKNIWS